MEDCIAMRNFKNNTKTAITELFVSHETVLFFFYHRYRLKNERPFWEERKTNLKNIKY